MWSQGGKFHRLRITRVRTWSHVFAILRSGLRGWIPSTRAASTQTLLIGQYLQNTLNYQIRLEVAHGVFFQQEISPLPVPHLRWKGTEKNKKQKNSIYRSVCSDERDIFNFRNHLYLNFLMSEYNKEVQSQCHWQIISQTLPSNTLLLLPWPYLQPSVQNTRQY